MKSMSVILVGFGVAAYLAMQITGVVMSSAERSRLLEPKHSPRSDGERLGHEGDGRAAGASFGWSQEVEGPPVAEFRFPERHIDDRIEADELASQMKKRLDAMVSGGDFKRPVFSNIGAAASIGPGALSPDAETTAVWSEMAARALGRMSGPSEYGAMSNELEALSGWTGLHQSAVDEWTAHDIADAAMRKAIMQYEQHLAGEAAAIAGYPLFFY